MDLRRILYDGYDDDDYDDNNIDSDSESDSEFPIQNNNNNNMMAIGLNNIRNNNLAAAHNHNNNSSKDITCWVFGYGSLCWNPGFVYTKCITGYIRGFVRRFWQGSIVHRGTPHKPGRVATLVAEKEGITWGCAYKITGETALEYLKQRECTIGGYVTLDSKFFPRIATCDTEFCGEAFPVLAYVATDKNDLWIGESSIEHVAQQVCECKGSSGHNVEYVLRLAEFMREEIPNENDEHLFDLEFHIIQTLAKQNTPLHLLMGIPPERIRRDSHADIQRHTTFEFASRVPDKKLRCLNI